MPKNVVEPTIPAAYLCPITKKIMLNPVRLASDGTVYEQDAIEAYMAKNPAKTPGGEEELKDKTLTEELFTKRKIKEFLADYPEYRNEQYQQGSGDTQTNAALQANALGLFKKDTMEEPSTESRTRQLTKFGNNEQTSGGDFYSPGWSALE